jgi:carbon-monoxide dehydrogenase large subunit
VSAPAPRIVGKKAKRIEDRALLRGEGRFVDDIRLEGELQAVFIRSPHAHARVNGIDASRACALPGVLAVLTAEDLAQALTRPRMPLGFPSDTLPSDGTPFVLAGKEVCFVGEAIAMVIAGSRYIAEDAAALVEVDFEVLDALADCRAALDPAAPKVRLNATSNVLQQYKVAYGDCTTPFSKGRHVFRESIWQHRGGAHPIEGRGVLARYDVATATVTVWSSTQMAHELYYTLADMLGIDENQVRVIAPDVGGGFGAKFLVYPEEIAVPAAARLLQRPIKWVEDRCEHFTSAIQERDQYWDVEICVDEEAKILGIRGTLIHDHGAYTPQGTNCAFNAASSMSGPYVVPAYDVEVYVAHTNKVPVTTVRGAGYPEAAFVMERLLDRVARELRLDRAEVRRRNLIPADKIPYAKPLKTRAGVTATIDSGDYLACQVKALAAADYADFPARQAAARKQGRYLGIGLAHGVKPTGRGPFESARVRVSPSGHVSVYTGAMAMGQGLKTSLAQVCAEHLGVTIEQIEVIAGDTAHVPLGMGGFASRQAIMAGSAVHTAALAVRQKAVKVAAKMFEAAEQDFVLRAGRVEIAGVQGMGVSLGEISRKLKGAPGYALAADVEPGLDATSLFRQDLQAYANACHVCEVEVDPGTGGVRILRYVAVQDSGRLINPMIAEGQVHGGVVHGIGNALFEWMRYDEAAQPITTTFADYLLPTATEVPNIEVLFHESPSTTNPLGVKGIGEVATVPVGAAVISAIENALTPFGVHFAEAPLLPVRIMQLMDDALRVRSDIPTR